MSSARPTLHGPAHAATAFFYQLFQNNAARAAAQADEALPEEVAESTPNEPAQDATPTTSAP